LSKPVIFLSTDLIFSSRVAGAARNAQVDLTSASSVEAAVARLTIEPASLVILDLTLSKLNVADAVSRLKQTSNEQAVLIAYAPHVHADVLKSAKEAGCDQVLTRGQFDQQIESILRTFAAPQE